MARQSPGQLLFNIMALADRMASERQSREMDDLAKVIKQEGVAGIAAELKRKLNSWKTIDLHIGVIGASGVGKSSFINAIRRVKPGDPGSAKSGVVQTTMSMKSYDHPNNPSMKFWDLPGVNTSEFPRSSYLQKIQFQRYDFFIIICCGRFTQDDIWFAKETREADKRFYFVRTKIDVDLQSEEEDYPSTYSVEAVLKKIRDNCTKELSKEGFTKQDVFLICKNPLLHDFPTLEEKLIFDLPVLKRQTALFTLRSTSRKVMAEKTAELKARSWRIAALSALTAMVPVPCLAIKVDTEVLIDELTFYKEQYDLDDKQLNQLSESVNVPKEVLTCDIKHHFWMNLTEKTLLDAMRTFGGLPADESASFLPIPIPIVSSIISVVGHFKTTKPFLCNTLITMEKAAVAVINKACSVCSSRGS